MQIKWKKNLYIERERERVFYVSQAKRKHFVEESEFEHNNKKNGNGRVKKTKKTRREGERKNVYWNKPNKSQSKTT